MGSLENIEIILNEKKLRINEVTEYNHRLDKIVIYYILGVYTALGIEFSGKIDLGLLSSSTEYVYLVFIFIFLNLCLILHGISECSFAIGLSQYVHIYLDRKLLRSIETKKDPTMKDFIFWEDYESGITLLGKNVRKIVVFLWIILVFFISLHLLSFVGLNTAFKEDRIIMIITCVIFFFYLTYTIHSCLLLGYYVNRYNEKRRIENILLKFLFIFVSLALASIFYYYIYMIYF
jgi:hypothetical protein